MDEAQIARVFQIFLALAGAYLLALWFALVIWTYRDITSRSANPFTQIFSTLVVVLFFVPGAIIYLILRPRETMDEAFQRTIEEEYLLQDLDEFPVCQSCRRAVRDDFVYCPYCHAELRHACVACHRLVDVRWDVCPYCGADQSDAVRPREEDEFGVVDQAPRRPRRRSAPLQAIDGGRASRRAEHDLDTTIPRPLRSDDEPVPAAVRSPDGNENVDQSSEAVDAPTLASDGEVRDRSARGRAMGRRRGESGN